MIDDIKSKILVFNTQSLFFSYEREITLVFLKKIYKKTYRPIVGLRAMT